LVLREQILYRVYEDENGKKSYLQLVVPKDLREGVLEESHAGSMEESHAGSMSGHLEELARIKEKVLLARLFQCCQGMV